MFGWIAKFWTKKPDPAPLPPPACTWGADWHQQAAGPAVPPAPRRECLITLRQVVLATGHLPGGVCVQATAFAMVFTHVRREPPTPGTGAAGTVTLKHDPHPLTAATSRLEWARTGLEAVN